MQPKQRPRRPDPSVRWKISPLTPEESEGEKPPSLSGLLPRFRNWPLSTSSFHLRKPMQFMFSPWLRSHSEGRAAQSPQAKQIGDRCSAPWLWALLCIGTGAPQLLPWGSWAEPQALGPRTQSPGSRFRLPWGPPACGAACSQRPWSGVFAARPSREAGLSVANPPRRLLVAHGSISCLVSFSQGSGLPGCSSSPPLPFRLL